MGQILDGKRYFKMIPVFHLLNLCIYISFVLAEGDYLYVGTIVKELDAKSIVDANNNDYITVFYAPWCGHCRNFVKSYVKMAEDFSDHNVIFSSLNCVEYSATCATFQIRSYPTLIAFSTKGFEQLNGTKHQKELTSRSSNDIAVFVHKYYTKKVSSQGHAHDTLSTSRRETPPTAPENRSQVELWLRDTIFTDARNASADLRIHDALISFQFMLVYQFQSVISETTVSHLDGFTQILVQLLPTHLRGPYAELRKLLDRRRFGIKYLKTNWPKLLNASLPATALLEWKTCRPLPNSFSQKHGSRIKDNRLGGGYTCGLWLLFHYITVASGTSRVVSAVTAMEAIHSFVNYFFACEACRTHFLEAYDACSLGRCDITSQDYVKLQVWLWRFHNTVTSRVFRDTTAVASDPQLSSESKQLLPLLEWPSRECPVCLATDESIKGNDRFIEKEVLAYLRQAYWSVHWSGEEGLEGLSSDKSVDSSLNSGIAAFQKHAAMDRYKSLGDLYRRNIHSKPALVKQHIVIASTGLPAATEAEIEEEKIVRDYIPMTDFKTAEDNSPLYSMTLLIVILIFIVFIFMMVCYQPASATSSCCYSGRLHRLLLRVICPTAASSRVSGASKSLFYKDGMKCNL